MYTFHSVQDIHYTVLLQGGPFHQTLHDVLGAYACYRPDVGYVSLSTLIVPLN